VAHPATFFIAPFKAVRVVPELGLERLQTLEERVAPTLEAMGFEVVRIALTGSVGRRTLQVMADRKDGSQISVDDCAQISHTLSAIFDVEDPIPGAYDLEVSSAGIDRPLTRPKDFAAYAGFEAKLETKMPVAGRRRFRGELGGVAGEAVVMTIDGAKVEIPINAIGTAKLIMTDELIEASAKRAELKQQS
jgi:ribosome maturation factor RimP